MMKRFLGVICLLYSGIIIYVALFDKLKFFLAPQMQIYIKLSVIPLIIIGLVMLFNRNVNYKFKISDLILLLPLILLIFSGDGRLTSSFANNRTTPLNLNRNKSEDKTVEKKEIEQQNSENKKSYDFSKPYFNVIDESYKELSEYLPFNPKAEKYKGKTIRLRGFIINKLEFLQDEYFAIGKYAISCCAADAGFTGFIAKYDKNKIEDGKWYEVEGILKKGKDKEGFDIMYIEVINIKEINSKDEEQYVYPCYSYKDGSCKEMSKYNLEY